MISISDRNMVLEHATKRRAVRQEYILRFIVIVYMSMCLLLSGCSERSLTFQVRFPEVSGLKQNDPVYFGKNLIGGVKKISYTDQGDYLVEVEIAPGFKNAATEDSRFYIEHSVNNEQNMGVIVVQERPGGVVLPNGAVVLGSVRTGSLAEVLSDLQNKAGAVQNELNNLFKELKKSLDTTSRELDRQLEATLDKLFFQFNSFADDLGKLPDRKEIEQLEESFQQFADEFQKVQKDVQDRLRNEIIPLFRTELERLRKQFKKEGREKELEPIDKQIEELYMV
jgi:ABC-type transporter Mla subunit MlaD